MPFEKGNTLGAGNAGRPRNHMRIPEEVREHLGCATMKAAKAMTDALDAMYPVMNRHGELVGHEPDHPLRLKAAEAIMNRLYGKPTETIQGPDGEAPRLDVNVIAEKLRKLVDG